MDEDLNRESNHAVYAVSCTDIMKGSYNTKTRGESRIEPKCKVRNSPLIVMSCLKSEDLEINGIDDILDMIFNHIIIL